MASWPQWIVEANAYKKHTLQVENLTRKAQLQEVELERTTKQLKEAIAIAEEETAKSRAAKEVIKTLTAQVRFCYQDGILIEY